jgi:hypothetical protein
VNLPQPNEISTTQENHMKTHATVVLAFALLAACSKTDNPPPPNTAVPSTGAPVTQATPPLPTPDGARDAPVATDNKATDPTGQLTKGEESNSMPMAGHGNNHSSPSLETAPKEAGKS